MPHGDSVLSRDRTDVSRRRPTATLPPRWALAAGAASLVAALATAAPLPVLGVLAILVLAVVSARAPRVFIVLMIASTFASRFSVDLAGATVRPELIVGAAAAGGLLLPGPAGRRAPDRFVTVSGLLIGAWLLWLTAVSAFAAPQPSKSLAIVLWLALDLACAAWIARRRDLVDFTIGWGIVLSSGLAVLGIGLWVLATLGIWKYGVQYDSAYGGFAVFVWSHEANIFAGLIVLWSLVAMTSIGRLAPSKARLTLICAAPMVCVAAHTRAALLTWLLAVVALAVLRRGRAIFASVIGGGLVLFVGIKVFAGSDSGLGKFLDPFDFKSGTGLVRQDAWRRAAQDILGSGYRLLIGGGANSFSQNYTDPTQPGSGAPWYLSNLPLQIVYDGGLVAAVVFVSACAVLLVGARSRSAAVLACAALVLNLSTSALWFLQSWVFVGLLVAVHSRRPDRWSGSRDVSPSAQLRNRPLTRSYVVGG